MGKIKAYTYEEYSDLQSRHNELTLKLRKLVVRMRTADNPSPLTRARDIHWAFELEKLLGGE